MTASASETKSGADGLTWQVTLRTIAMPADTNPDGAIFGGWVMSQMDLAGGMLAQQHAQGRVVTIAVDGMRFHKPIAVGDAVTCYAALLRVGRTSLTVKVRVEVERYSRSSGARHGVVDLVTEAQLSFVHVNHDGRPIPLPSLSAASA